MHLAAVHAVGYPPERELDERAAEHGARHEECDVGVGQVDLVGIDGAERAEGAIDQPDQDAADGGHRRVGVEPAKIEAIRLEWPRMLRGRQRRGQDGEAIEDRADHEEEEVRRRRDHHEELAGGRRSEVHHLVDREDGAAILPGGALVQPGFDHHGGAGEAEAGDPAHQDPGGRRQDQKVEEDHHGGKRRHRGIDADMADAADDRRDRQAAANEADRPAGADQAELEGREAVMGALDRQEQPVQPTGDQKEGRADEERGDREQGRSHQAGALAEGKGAAFLRAVAAESRRFRSAIHSKESEAGWAKRSVTTRSATRGHGATRPRFREGKLCSAYIAAFSAKKSRHARRLWSGCLSR